MDGRALLDLRILAVRVTGLETTGRVSARGLMNRRRSTSVVFANGRTDKISDSITRVVLGGTEIFAFRRACFIAVPWLRREIFSERFLSGLAWLKWAKEISKAVRDLSREPDHSDFQHYIAEGVI